MYPEYVEINGEKYKINTDFRVAIRCNEVAQDETISDIERAEAIIYLLFGDKGLNDYKNHNKLLELGQKYLLCGEELNAEKNEKPDMDFVEDEKYIKSSFKYDYNYNPYSMEYLHWYEFYNDLVNLSNSELGDCCILNRIVNIRKIDLREIKDKKERDRLKKLQDQVALKKYKNKKQATDEQRKSAENFYKQLGIKKEG